MGASLLVPSSFESEIDMDEVTEVIMMCILAAIIVGCAVYFFRNWRK